MVYNTQKTLSGQRYPTLSLLFVFEGHLLKKMNTAHGKLATPTGLEMYGRFMESYHRRWMANGIWLSPMSRMALMLDPRMKDAISKMTLTPDQQRDTTEQLRASFAVEWVRSRQAEMVRALPEPAPLPSTGDTAPTPMTTTVMVTPSTVPGVYDDLFDILRSNTAPQPAPSTDDDAVNFGELESYLSTPTNLSLFTDNKEFTDPLQWWRDIGSLKYPLMAKLARKFLSVPCTSVPAERMFSSSGLKCYMSGMDDTLL